MHTLERNDGIRLINEIAMNYTVLFEKYTKGSLPKNMFVARTKMFLTELRETHPYISKEMMYQVELLINEMNGCLEKIDKRTTPER